MKRVHYYSESNNVYYNLALEEYFVRNIDFERFELLFVYINEPSIVLGKNQNFFQEVHLKSFFQAQYKLARRISGGGTVVHDMGNINFAFFENYRFQDINKYQKSTGQIMEALNKSGISISMNERNALILDNGKKVSGSAQFSSNKAILSHLTLLYKSNLESLNNLIRPNNFSLKTNASKSVRSIIDNVSNHTDLTQENLILRIIQDLGYSDKLDEALIDIGQVNKLVEEKYNNEAYIYDKAASGTISTNGIELELHNGWIQKISGIDKAENYLNKRLLPQDIPLSDPLWEVLLHDDCL